MVRFLMKYTEKQKQALRKKLASKVLNRKFFFENL